MNHHTTLTADTAPYVALADYAKLDAAKVREFLDYDPETGALTWRRRDAKWFRTRRHCSVWNARYAGKEAFTHIHSNGCKEGRIFNKGYLAHRIAWLHYYGQWPVNHIDHINHDPCCNKIANLRDVTSVVNSQNMSMPSNNSSGVVGVTWTKRDGGWKAQIGVKSSVKYLGCFVNFEEAVAARRMAERDHGFHENHGKQSVAHIGLAQAYEVREYAKGRRATITLATGAA